MIRLTMFLTTSGKSPLQSFPMVWFAMTRLIASARLSRYSLLSCCRSSQFSPDLLASLHIVARQCSHLCGEVRRPYLDGSFCTAARDVRRGQGSTTVATWIPLTSASFARSLHRGPYKYVYDTMYGEITFTCFLFPIFYHLMTQPR